MRTDVLQAITICLHGNAYLADPSADRVSELLGSNSLFKCVFELAFERQPQGGRMMIPLGNSVAPWLRRLKTEDVRQLRLYLAKLAFPGDKVPDGEWGIVTDGNVGTELWEPLWKSRLVRYDEPSSWKVTYSAHRFLRWTIAEPPTGDFVFGTLERDWKDLHAHALQLGQVETADQCDRMLHLHLAESSTLPSHQDLLPPTLADHSLILTSSCVRAIMTVLSPSVAYSLKHRNATEFTLAARQLWRTALTGLECISYQERWAKAS